MDIDLHANTDVIVIGSIYLNKIYLKLNLLSLFCRKNPTHKKEYAHPGDHDYHEAGSGTKAVCRYGASCYRLVRRNSRNRNPVLGRIFIFILEPQMPNIWPNTAITNNSIDIFIFT